MLRALEGAVELGLLYAVMALGVYITFRILEFPDLTVDGSFTTGGAIAAVAITAGWSPWLATALAFFGGLAAGFMTGLLHTKGKINGLLSGILMMIALYSINMRILGKPNVSLARSRVDSVFTALESDLAFLPLMVWLVVFVLIVKAILDWFFKTDLGLALRVTGDNLRMIQSFGANTDRMKMIGVSLSNGLVAMSGALIAQYQGFADISMGVGMIVIGLASVIIGEAVFGARTVVQATLAVILGAVIYRIVYALALRVDFLEASDMKVITAFIVIVALVVPTFRRAAAERSAARRRSAELAGGDR